MKMIEKDVTKHLNDLAKIGTPMFPSDLSLAIVANVENLEKELERVDKVRKSICERLAKKDENGKALMKEIEVGGQKTSAYDIDDEGMVKFQEEYGSLMDVEVDIEIRTVKKEVLKLCDENPRYDVPTVQQLYAMSFMLVD